MDNDRMHVDNASLPLPPPKEPLSLPYQDPPSRRPTPDKMSDIPPHQPLRNDNSTFPHPSLNRTDSLGTLIQSTAMKEDMAPRTQQKQPTAPSELAAGADRVLNVTDALSYLDSVKIQFQDQPDVYNHFLDIMKDFKSQAIDTPGVIRRVSHLFHGHPSLIQGFNTFLPVGYRIEAHESSNYITVTTPTGTMMHTGGDGANGESQWQHMKAPSPEPVDAGEMMVEEDAIEPAVQYVQKIKQRCDPDTYRQFLDILSRYHKTPMDIDEVSAQIALLFKDAPDLRADFKVFMPDKGQSHALLGGSSTPARVGTPASQSRRRGGQSTPVPQESSLPQKRKRKLVDRDKEREPVTGSSGAKASSSTSNLGKKQKVQGSQDLSSPSLAGQSSSGLTSRKSLGIYQQALPPNSFERGSMNQQEDRQFFERVRRALESREVYSEFLKIVNLFTQNYIDTGRLVKEARNFLGDGELMKQFKEILGWDERKEREHRLAEHHQQMFYGYYPQGGGKVATSAVGGVRTLPGRVDQSKLYGSYRRLPPSEANVPCSGRDEMCRSVLNDEWVSHPTWASEDTGFSTHKKNLYEEALHRSEEERHEYDFHIEAITRTIAMLEPINNKIAQLPEQERHAFKLKANFGGSGKAIHHRLVKKIYGRDAGLEVIKAMQDTPALAIPVVLSRLKQKEEEWKRAQREWNKVWREVDARNYPKSLDYQSVSFKAADKKAISTKTFLSQIEALRDQKHARRAALVDPLFMRTQPRHHMEFLVEDMNVLQDSLKLTFSFLDRTQSQINFADRKRIEGFLRSFVPSLLGLDVAAFQAAFAANGQGENGGFDGGELSDDMMSMLDDGGEEAGGVNGSGSGGGKRRKGPSATNGSGDLRKRLLKSEQAKSTNRKTRGQEGASPAGSRFSSPALFDKPMDAPVNGDTSAPASSATPSSKVKYPFFCNAIFYVLVRLLETLYSRLALFKAVSAEMVAEPTHASSRAQFDGVERTNHTQNFYGLILETCERLFDNEIEQTAFEDQMRHMLGNKAFKIFTIDKLIGAIIKQVLCVFNDPKSQDFLENLKRSRTIASPTTQDLTNIQRSAEKSLGPDGNLYRIDWVPDTKMITIQLLGSDDPNCEDPEVLTGRWQAYLDSYVSSDETAGVPATKVKRPFLRKNIPVQLKTDTESSAVQAGSRGALEIKVCVRTYRLFFVSGTEDYLWKAVRKEDIEDVQKRVEKKDLVRKKWIESNKKQDLEPPPVTPATGSSDSAVVDKS